MSEWQTIAKLLAAALAAIGKVVGTFENADEGKARDALTIISALLDAVAKGTLDKIDPERAEEELQTLLSALADNDAEIDKIISDIKSG
jgi:hypothetical protein